MQSVPVGKLRRDAMNRFWIDWTFLASESAENSLLLDDEKF